MKKNLILCCVMVFLFYTGCGEEATRGMSTDPNEFPEDLQVLEIDATPTPTIVPVTEIDVSVSNNEVGDYQDDEITLILNTGTMKAHKTDCSSVKDIKSENSKEYIGTIDEIVKEGYQACKKCHPF